MENIQEKIFFQDQNVLVTQARFIAGSKTYAMRNISSVSNHEIKKSKVWPIIMLVLALLLVFSDDLQIAGFVIGILGGLWLYGIKTEYSVRINSNSGEADGFISKDRQYIQQIVDALNEAVVYRG